MVQGLCSGGDEAGVVGTPCDDDARTGGAESIAVCGYGRDGVEMMAAAAGSIRFFLNRSQI